MNIFSKLTAKITTAVLGLGALASSVMAASYDYYYDSYSTDDAGIGAIFAGANIIILCCYCLFLLVAASIWIWMLIDVLKRTETELPDKTTWILIVILLGPLGAVIYFFAKRRELNKKK